MSAEDSHPGLLEEQPTEEAVFLSTPDTAQAPIIARLRRNSDFTEEDSAPAAPVAHSQLPESQPEDSVPVWSPDQDESDELQKKRRSNLAHHDTSQKK